MSYLFHDDIYNTVKQDPVHNYSFKAQQKHAIVIDNGSYQCRAGWSIDDEPKLVFRPLVGKMRATDLKAGVEVPELALKNGYFLIGNDFNPIDYAKYNARTAFDKDVVYNYDLQEQIFDYIFYKLGLSSESCVRHPVLLTEPVCNPNYARKNVSELLFECYQVPSVCMGIDALFSYYKYGREHGNTGLIIRSGFIATHILPIFDIRQTNDKYGDVFSCDLQHVKRLSIGGYSTTDYMLKILQLKYHPLSNSAISASKGPMFVTVPRAQELKERHCLVVPQYRSELQRLATDEHYFNDFKRRIFANEETKQWFEKRMQELGTVSHEHTPQTTVSTTVKNLVSQFESKDQAERWLRAQNSKLNAVVQELYKVKEQINILDTNITATGENQQQQQQQAQAPTTTKSKRSAANKQRQKAKIAAQIHEGEDETFGMSDNDWSLYSSIDDSNIELLKSSKEFNKNRSELSKQQQEYEQQIATLTREIQLVEQELYGSQKSAPPTFFLNQYYDEHCENVYMDVAVERIRIPEILFSPSMIGMEVAGLGELIQVVLGCYPLEKRLDLVRNVYLSGGNTQFEGFNARVEAEIRQIMPERAEINIRSEPDMSSAWRGAAKFAQDHKNDQCWVTKKQYEEMGGDYLAEHSCSNLFIERSKYEQNAMDEDDE